MKAVFAEHGRFVTQDVPEPAVAPGMLLVAVKAAGLNAADQLILHGRHITTVSTRRPAAVAPASKPMGAEAAGEVVAVGAGVDGFAVGDRVMSVCGGAFAEYALVPGALAARVPDRLSWAEAAAVPVVFATAHDALMRAGAARIGDHVLVTAASSGVGIAALQLARLAGAATVAASSRTQDKLDALRAAGIHFDIGLLAGDPRFAEHGLAAIDDHGFDVVIDHVGAPALRDNLAVAALGGRIVSVGRMGGTVGEIDLDELARKRVALVGVTFRTRSPHELFDVHRRAFEDVVPALADGTVRVVLDRVFPFEDLVAAQAWMEDGRQIGKVVVEMS